MSLMDDPSMDFSFRSLRRRLHRLPGPPAKLEFQELRLVDDVVLVYGGWAPSASSTAAAPLETFKRQQVESLHVKGMDHISKRIQDATGNLLVCLESALPSEPCPSIGYIAAEWFSARVSKQGVEEVYRGNLDRPTPGSLAELIVLLALLDFLTATPSTGFGSTASRIVTLKVREGGAQCVAHMELQAIFGAPDIDAVRHTAVIQLFQGKDTQDAKTSLLETLRSTCPQCRVGTVEFEKKLNEAVQLMSAAATCLNSQASKEDLAEALWEVDISWDDWLRIFADPDDAGFAAVDLLGLELYRSAVQGLLECLNEVAGFYAGETMGLDPVKASLTVLQTCAAPASWAQDPLQQPEILDTSTAMSHSGCVVALRCHLLQHAIDSRFNRLYGGPFKIPTGPDPDPRLEKRWQELFESVDVNRNGEVSMDEWKEALDDEDNEELRDLFEFDQRPMRILAKKLFGSVHVHADSWVDMEEFRKACRMAYRSELKWHFIYMMAGREAEKADDRPEEEPFSKLISWNRSCIEHGLLQEDAVFKKYKAHTRVWKKLAVGKCQAWDRHCNSIIGLSEAAHELHSPGRDATQEVLSRHFDSQIFIKIAFNTSKSFEDVALFGQLTLLQCHILEKIWEALFPKYSPEASGMEECSGLHLGIHYILPREDSGAYFSLEGWHKWTRWQEADENWPASQATQSVSSSRIAPSDATMLQGANVLTELSDVGARPQDLLRCAASEVPSLRGGNCDETHQAADEGGADGSAGVQPSVSRAGDPLVGFLVESSRNLVDLRPGPFSGLDGFETIPAPQKRPDSLGSVAIASPTSTSSEVVHQPLTPQVRPSRGSSSEISASLPRVGAGPLPPLPEAENQDPSGPAAPRTALPDCPGLPEEDPQEDPQDYPADPELGSDSDEQTEESASGTEESGESEDASENSEMHAESEKLAVELHAEFRRRPRVNSHRRSTITEDNSGTRFMQMLEDALWDTCKFRPPQIKCKTLEFVENAPKVLGGWNVTLWIYSLKPSMNSDLVVKNVNQLVEKYEEWAGEDRTGDFFQKYAWVWCKFKAGKDQPYKECKPSGVNAPKNDSSQRHGALREDIAEETVVQDTRIAPAPLQEAVQAVQAVQHVASTSSRWQACSRWRLKPHYSTTPRTLDLAVRFQGGAFSHDEVKQNMVKLLGLQNCQLTLMALELGELGGSYSEAKLQIRTLSPAPATEETEALQAKLMYLHRYGHSSSLRLPGGWKWVAVVSGLASKEVMEEFAVSFTLKLETDAASLAETWEELRADLAQKLGFHVCRLQISDVRHQGHAAVIQVRIGGFSRDRAEMLKDFLESEEAMGKTGSELPLLETSDVKVIASDTLPYSEGQAWNDEVMAMTPMQIGRMIGKLNSKSLNELMEEYVRCCEKGPTGQHKQDGKPYHFYVIKQIEDIIKKLREVYRGRPSESLKRALSQHHIGLPLLLDFGKTLMRVVEVHGESAPEEDRKDYFLSQGWQPEEMRYALRLLAFVLSWDTRGFDGPEVQPADVQVHLSRLTESLVKVMAIYKTFLASLDESDLSRGLYRPCNVLQSLQTALLGIQTEPSSESVAAWLAGTDVLDSLSKLLCQSRCRSYSFVHGHAVALLFPPATQMTCKAFFAKDKMLLQSDAICKNVSKLMRAMVNWTDINGSSTSSNWSTSLDEAIQKISLPQLARLLNRLKLPPTHAIDLVGKLREWTQFDIINLLDGSPLPLICLFPRQNIPERGLC